MITLTVSFHRSKNTKTKKTNSQTGYMERHNNVDRSQRCLKDINGVKKTAIINDELLKLNVDIATYKKLD